jgi:hypothetical protein
VARGMFAGDSANLAGMQSDMRYCCDCCPVAVTAGLTGTARVSIIVGLGVSLPPLPKHYSVFLVSQRGS